MSIEEYVNFITRTPFPVLFIFFIIFCEFTFYKIKGKKFSFSHTFSNFGVLIIGVLLFSLFSSFVFSRDSVLTFVQNHTLFPAKISWTYFFIWLVIFDFINYWSHVMYHKSDFFWMFHSVHHSDKELDASTTVRVPFTASFFTVTSYAFLGFFGVSLVLLPAIAQTMLLQQVIVHSFLFRDTFPSWVSYIFVTPEIHALHHTEKYSNKNYSFLLSLWDHLFNTYTNETLKDERFGIVSSSDTRNSFKIHQEPVLEFIRKK